LLPISLNAAGNLQCWGKGKRPVAAGLARERRKGLNASALRLHPNFREYSENNLLNFLTTGRG
jgi:hypothetical protein